VSKKGYPTLTNPHIKYIFDDSETHYAFVGNKEQLDKTKSLIQECEHMKGYVLMDDSEADTDNVFGFNTLIEKGKAYKLMSVNHPDLLYWQLL